MQWHFEFNEWEEAFELFYRRKERNESLCLVVSSSGEVSGYWIEPASGAEPDDETHVYLTVQEVKALERRVRRQCAKKASLSLGLVT